MCIEAKNFCFVLPQNIYHSVNSKVLLTKNYESKFSFKITYKGDHHVNLIKNWLKTLKLEKYLINFVSAGYYSMELMTLQMISK